MTSTSPEPEDETLPDDPVEERRSRLLRIARLFGGMLLAGTVAAAVVALAVAILVKLGPDLVVIEPGTTSLETPTATATRSNQPEPIQTLTRLPSNSAQPS